MLMKTMKFIVGVLIVYCMTFSLVSCDGDDDFNSSHPAFPNALVTVKPLEDGGFYMQLDDSTTLYPDNVSKSPYGSKEVRALVNYREVDPAKYSDGQSDAISYTKHVTLNWIDSILTKPVVAYPAEGAEDKYGNDPLEIVKDWTTVAEDGYLTLRFRTRWGGNTVHYINLLTGKNPDNPYEVELRHNAYGDLNGRTGDALVAFKIKDISDADMKTVKLTMKYMSFSGEKTITIDFSNGKIQSSSEQIETAEYSSSIK